MENLQRKRGFTLIELVVVISVLAILLLLAAPKFLGYISKANEIHITADIKTLETVLESKMVNDPDYLQTFEYISGNDAAEIYSSGLLMDKKGKEIKSGSNLYLIKEPDFKTGLKGNFYSNDNAVVFYLNDKAKNKEEIILNGKSLSSYYNISFTNTCEEWDTFADPSGSGLAFEVSNSQGGLVIDAYVKYNTSTGQYEYGALNSDTLVIPCKIAGEDVLEIGDSVFANSGIKNLVIPETVIEIWSGAFEGNEIETLILPNVQFIYSDAFKDNNIQRLSMPSVKAIGDNAFAGNNLKVVKLNEINASNLNSSAFTNNPDLIYVINCTGISDADLAKKFESSGSDNLTILICDK